MWSIPIYDWVRRNHKVFNLNSFLYTLLSIYIVISIHMGSAQAETSTNCHNYYLNTKNCKSVWHVYAILILHGNCVLLCSGYGAAKGLGPNIKFENTSSLVKSWTRQILLYKKCLVDVFNIHQTARLILWESLYRWKENIYLTHITMHKQLHMLPDKRINV